MTRPTTCLECQKNLALPLHFLTTLVQVPLDWHWCQFTLSNSLQILAVCLPLTFRHAVSCHHPCWTLPHHGLGAVGFLASSAASPFPLQQSLIEARTVLTAFLTLHLICLASLALYCCSQLKVVVVSLSRCHSPLSSSVQPCISCRLRQLTSASFPVISVVA